MKMNKYLSIITIAISLTAFILSLCWHSSADILTKYWVNVMLAIFGSGLLLAFASVAGYFAECRKYRIANLAFARNFLVQTGNSLMYISSNNPNPETVYRELFSLCSVYDNFAFENFPIIKDYYCTCSYKRQRMQVTHNMINEIKTKLVRAKSISQEAISNPTADYHAKLYALLKETNTLCEKLLTLFQPNPAKQQELQEP